jgi:hypothetical protein
METGRVVHQEVLEAHAGELAGDDLRAIKVGGGIIAECTVSVHTEVHRWEGYLALARLASGHPQA